MILLTAILLILGLLFILLGAVGILRLPDFYSRLHAMGKCDTLGVALILLALALYAEVSLTTLKLLLVSTIIGLANPTATHALGRAALKAGLTPWTRDVEQR
jgi:multicomponent Na+:H+ antiporter subunit G